ncbi:hypothetical protein [Empedobacter brevis]|uniref:DUF1493 family protein n=2 Tax=Empedobacter brevis TaxID=247 RepID=A0A511NCX0_9FLAO|nr:hypothetical protein [Empedobacter brevis]GEM50663.1 hypothetical protein EB1_04530 [Empedobacter brevis NBRC 14943 = ATCC 43319]
MEEKQVLYVDFASLRKSHTEIKQFIEKSSYEKVDNSDILIEQDLGFCGDDTYFIMEEFVEKYNLDFSKFNFSEHFLNDLELFNSFQVVLNIVFLPLYFLLWLVKEFTFDLINLNKYLIKIVKLFSTNQRETLDMSFGDLLTSYTNKKYTLRSSTKFVLRNF